MLVRSHRDGLSSKPFKVNKHTTAKDYAKSCKKCVKKCKDIYRSKIHSLTSTGTLIMLTPKNQYNWCENHNEWDHAS